MKIPKVKTKDLLTVVDLQRGEIIEIFKLASRLKKDLKRGSNRDLLAKKSLAMIFEKSSTRTRVSFETGITQLGGHALFLDRDDIQLTRGETMKDTAKVLSRYVDAIMIRTFSHDKVVELASNATIPVINGLTDTFHPCQALSDYFTIYEREKDLTGVKIAYVGDGNNVANSLLQGAGLLGINIAVACPAQYSPDPAVVETARMLSSLSGADIEITTDIDSAVRGADYLYTDVWFSMGEEKKSVKKKKLLSSYKITKKLLQQCNKNCRVMHCLPAHRDEEIEGDIIDSGQSIIFEQAENRLHVQKAVMCALMG